MSTADKSMIRQCLFNSTLREIREIEDIDYSFIEASPDFKERIKSSIEATPRKRKLYPKKLTFILVATLIMCFLITFSVSAKVRTAVFDFFVNVYQGFASFSIDKNEKESAPKTIEAIYFPYYVTDNGFEKTYEYSGKSQFDCVWKNKNTEIRFKQSTIHNSDSTINIEDIEHSFKYVGEQKVFYTTGNGVITALWFTDEYMFSVSCNEALGWEEVEKIVLSVKEN